MALPATGGCDRDAGCNVLFGLLLLLCVVSGFYAERSRTATATAERYLVRVDAMGDGSQVPSNATRHSTRLCTTALAAAAVACLWVMISQKKKQKKNTYMMKIKARCTETPGNRLIHSRRKKNFERRPRELQCSDRAQTLTTGSGRSSYVDTLRGLAKSARAKGYDPKQTRFLHIYAYIQGFPSGSGVFLAG